MKHHVPEQTFIHNNNNKNLRDIKFSELMQTQHHVPIHSHHHHHHHAVSTLDWEVGFIFTFVFVILVE